MRLLLILFALGLAATTLLQSKKSPSALGPEIQTAGFDTNVIVDGPETVDSLFDDEHEAMLACCRSGQGSCKGSRCCCKKRCFRCNPKKAKRSHCTFTARLSGSEEVPPVETRTRGKACFRVHRCTRRRRRRRRRRQCVDHVHFGLRTERGRTIYASNGAHIHCGRPGENGPIAVWLAGIVQPVGLNGTVVSTGTFWGDSVLQSNCSVAGNLDSLLRGMCDGATYVNVHSGLHQLGEVRGKIRTTDSGRRLCRSLPPPVGRR